MPAVLARSWGTLRFRRLFVALAGILNHSLTRYGSERFDRVTDIVAEHELHPMLNGTERPAADELRRGAASVVAPLLALDHAEREFSERLQRGELQPEILFPDDSETAERLRAHPALRWKAENAGRHSRVR